LRSEQSASTSETSNQLISTPEVAMR
jgi:hypothetical protein